MDALGTLSRHGLMDVWLNTRLEKHHLDSILKVIRSKFTVIEEIRHNSNEAGGETIVFLLSESHFSLHIHPSRDFLTLDVFCSDPNTALEPVFEQIKSILPTERASSSFIQRGKAPRRQVSRRTRTNPRQKHTPTWLQSKDLPLF